MKLILAEFTILIYIKLTLFSCNAKECSSFKQTRKKLVINTII